MDDEVKDAEIAALREAATMIQPKPTWKEFAKAIEVQAKVEVLREVRDYLLAVGYRDTGDDQEIDYLNEKLKALEATR